MFSFRSARPAERRASSSPSSAAAALLQGQEAVTDLPPLSLLTAPAPVPFALHFLVRYTLAEYTGFMWQHAGYLIRRRRVGALNSRYLRLKSTFMAALHFVLLRRGSRTYDMTIDTHGIVRVSDAGVTLIGWDDVRLIRRYKQGFVMVLQRGTLPIPYRCLQPDEISALRSFAQTLKHGL